MRSLDASLNSHPLAMLRGIAELRGFVLATNNRAEAAAQLAAVLAEPQTTEATLAGCSPAANAAWATLRDSGGRMKLPAFTRSFGQFRPIGPGRLEREAVWRDPQSPAEELWYVGLIFAPSRTLEMDWWSMSTSRTSYCRPDGSRILP